MKTGLKRSLLILAVIIFGWIFMSQTGNAQPIDEFEVPALDHVERVDEAVAQRLCGNGILDPGEECDHGTSNGMLGDDCQQDCTLIPDDEEDDPIETLEGEPEEEPEDDFDEQIVDDYPELVFEGSGCSLGAAASGSQSFALLLGLGFGLSFLLRFRKK